MTILDDAREGMNERIRPQDDLFGHVNGTWLDTVEIPSDRASWGPFVTLADEAEQQVRVIIEEQAEGTKIDDLYASFMDEARVEELGAKPIQPVLEAIAALRDKRDLAAFLGEFERMGGSGLFGSYVDTDDRQSDRYIVNILQGGIGLPDESYYREDKYAEIREKYLAYLTRMLELVGHDDPAGTAKRVLDLETRLAKGHWERAATRDVLKTYNLTTYADLKKLLPSFDFDAYLTNIGGSPDAGLTITLPQAMGYERAMRFMMENRTVVGAEALEWGMAGEVVDDAGFESRLAAYCEQLCEWSPITMRLLKRGIVKSYESNDMEQQLRYEVTNIGRAFRSEDGQEARRAFLEKRKPVFQGR